MINSLMAVSIFMLPSLTTRAQEDCIGDFDETEIREWRRATQSLLNDWIEESGMNVTTEAQEWALQTITQGHQYQNKLVAIDIVETDSIKPLTGYILSVRGENEIGLEETQRLTDIFRRWQITNYTVLELPWQINEILGQSSPAIYGYMQDQTAKASEAGVWLGAVREMNTETISYLDAALAEHGIQDDGALSTTEMAGLFARSVDVNICSIPPGAEVHLVPHDRRLGVTTIDGEVFEAGRTYRLRFKLGGCLEVVKDYHVPYQEHEYDILELLECAGG
jgi:hypothetical protein